eukprot:m.154574 g.154574  ORF g.154574 m.154574 type:complete len:371 (-) comp23517_c0_seq2:129-1241(-)
MLTRKSKIEIREQPTNRSPPRAFTMVLVLGFVLAAVSAVCNGSFAALSKKYPSDPHVFNLQFCFGVLVSSMLAPAFYTFSGSEFGVTPFGIGAGLLLVLSTLFSFLAIPRVGLAIGQGVWGGVAILVSFLWGAIGPSEISNPLRSLPLSAMAIGYLLFGIYGILLSARYSTTGGAGGTSNPTASDDETEALLAEGPESETAVQLTEGGSQRGGRFAAGMVCAVLVGLFGGSILAPLAFVSDELSGIGFLPSFGIGAFASGVLIDGTYLVVHRRTSPSLGVIVRTALPGMAAGLVWNAGNVCSILAMGSIGNLSYGVAYPIMQCALFVSGLWGIFYFKEVTGRVAIGAFFVSGFVLIGGAVILSIYGPTPD